MNLGLRVNRQLPFFVYGALLPGQPNHYLWRDGIRKQQAAAARTSNELNNWWATIETVAHLHHAQEEEE